MDGSDIHYTLAWTDPIHIIHMYICTFVVRTPIKITLPQLYHIFLTQHAQNTSELLGKQTTNILRRKWEGSIIIHKMQKITALYHFRSKR